MQPDCMFCSHKLARFIQLLPHSAHTNALLVLLLLLPDCCPLASFIQLLPHSRFSVWTINVLCCVVLWRAVPVILFRSVIRHCHGPAAGGVAAVPGAVRPAGLCNDAAAQDDVQAGRGRQVKGW